MDYLDANTRFTQDEISDMAKYAAGERVSRADFDEMCEEHNLQSPSLAARLFDTFDTSDDGIVSFRELVLCLSELTRGTIKDLKVRRYHNPHTSLWELYYRRCGL